MSGGVTYHRLAQDNAAQLLPADVFDNPVDPAQLAAFVADPGHELVFATLAGRVVGLASGTILLHPDKLPILLVNEVGVACDMRRRGIGAALCERLISIARDRGCHGIWLATEADNAAARALYRKLRARETEGAVIYDWDGAMDD